MHRSNHSGFWEKGNKNITMELAKSPEKVSSDEIIIMKVVGRLPALTLFTYSFFLFFFFFGLAFSS